MQALLNSNNIHNDLFQLQNTMTIIQHIQPLFSVKKHKNVC